MLSRQNTYTYKLQLSSISHVAMYVELTTPYIKKAKLLKLEAPLSLYRV